MKKSFFWSIIFLLFILYYFLFPLTAEKEHIWTPRSVTTLDRVHGRDIPFLEYPVVIRTGEYAGILSPENGSILRQSSRSERDYSLSHTFKTTGPDSAVLLNRVNNKYTLFKGEGSPLIVNDHYLLADYSRALIREVDTAGNILWSWEGVSPLTALSASDRTVAFGTLDGIIHIYRKDGKSGLLEPFPEGDDSIVYGLSFSPDSGRLAVVAGRNRQSIILYKESSALEYEELWRLSLESRYSRPVKVVLSHAGDAVWLEQPGKLFRYTDAASLQEYPIDGRLLRMIPDEENSMVFIISTLEPGKNLLSVFSLDGRILIEEELGGDLSHFTQDRGQISLITGRKLILLNREIY